MKSAEEIMEILEAYDLTGSLRDAAELAGCSHHTVASLVAARQRGELTPGRAERRDMLVEQRRIRLAALVSRNSSQAEPLSLAHDLLRRGLTPSALRAYRILQSAFWQRWMSLTFQLTSDNDELQQLLAVSARSLFSFIDDTNAAITEQMQRDREELTRGTQAERRETVELILAGASIGKQRAASRLGYSLDQNHTAAIVWSDLPDSDSTLLNRATEALAQLAHTDRTLSVVATVATRWGVDGRRRPVRS